MSKKWLLRLLLPALLLGAAIILWLVWPQSTEHAGQQDLPEGAAIILLALAAVAALRSVFEGAFDIPLAGWAILALLAVIAVVFLYSSIAGAIGLLALLVLIGAFFMS